MTNHNESSDNSGGYLGVILRIIVGGIFALLMSPLVIAIQGLLFIYFILSMLVILILGILGIPAIVFSKELSDSLKASLKGINQKAVNSYKGVLKIVVEQHVKSAFLWGRTEPTDRARNYKSKYIDFIIDNAVFLGIVTFIATIIIIKVF